MICFLFLEKEAEGEKEIHIDVREKPQSLPLIHADQTHNPSMCHGQQ